MSSSPLQLVKEDAAGRSERSDDLLMALAAEGSSSAFAELVSRHEVRVRRLCALLVRDEALARDLAQEVFLKLWEQRSRYRPVGKLRELLLTMARNHCRSVLRRRRLAELVGLGEPPPLDVPAPDGALVEDERALLLRRALEKLPEKFRVPLALRFLEELPYEEIARVIGRNVSTTRSRVHYGLKELERALPEDVLP